MMYCPTTTQPRQMWGTQRVCMHGDSCVKYGCPYKHPSSRPRDCPHGDQCQHRDVCKLHHPRSCNEIACPFGLHCNKPNCPFAHDVAKTPKRFRKPCMHGAFCVKFGCGYAHPTGRRQECEFGVLCTNKACTKLHPRPSKKLDSKKLDSAKPKFEVGQQVQAQYKVGGTWRLANVLRANISSVTLQFVGWNDAVEIPFERIKNQEDRKPTVNNIVTPSAPLGAPPGFGPLVTPRGSGFNPVISQRSKFSCLISRGAAVAGGPSSPRRAIRSSPKSPSRKFVKSPVRKPVIFNSQKQSENLIVLEKLKRAAVLEENFLLANELKQKMEKMNDLEIKKAAAVRKEDFLLAMEIKKQITQLLPSTSTSICQETKQNCDDRISFSLFDQPLEHTSRIF